MDKTFTNPPDADMDILTETNMHSLSMIENIFHYPSMATSLLDSVPETWNIVRTWTYEKHYPHLIIYIFI